MNQNSAHALFKRPWPGGLLTAVAFILATMADDAAAGHRKLISSIGSERATSGNGNKIVTVDGKTHIVWQDANQDGYFGRVRTFDHTSGDWSPTYTLGKGRDNHARPTITADSKGYLHVIIGGHHTGLQYRRSVQPGDASRWTQVEAFGKTTYPVLICGPDDTLYLTGRHDSGWKGMDFYVKPPGAKWLDRGLLVAKQKRYKFYAGYHNALAWGPEHKTLHMSVGFFMGDRVRKGEHNRDPQGLHQAIGYMRSEDFGTTWTKADATPIRLPATTETIDLIDEGIRARSATNRPKPGIRHCGIAVDSQNRPHVVYVRHTPDPGPRRDAQLTVISRSHDFWDKANKALTELKEQGLRTRDIDRIRRSLSTKVKPPTLKEKRCIFWTHKRPEISKSAKTS